MDNNTIEENNDQIRRQQANRSSFYILLFLFSLLFFNFSEDSSVRTGKPTKEDIITQLELEKQRLDNLTFGVNVTHPLPTSVLKPVEDLRTIHNSHSHYYHNITAIFKGDWNNRNISLSDKYNSTKVMEARRNFQFDGPGSITINLKSVVSIEENVNYIEGHINLLDAEKSDTGALMLAEGVHFINNGSIFLMTVLDGLAIPLEELLHMLPNNQSMTKTRNIFIEQINKKMDEIQKEKYWDLDYTNDTSFLDEAPFLCQFQLFGQLHPVPSYIKMSELLDYERELENYQGISTIHPPALLLSSELYSPNCQLALSLIESEGTKIEVYYQKASMFASIVSCLTVAQIFALIRQMEYTPTPSSVSNVSYWTLAMQAIMDGYLCLLYLTIGVVMKHVFLPFASAAFFTFLLVSIFGMRYILVVWRTQRPESIPSPASDTEHLLPVSHQVRRPNPNEASNPQRDITSLYYRLYAVLLFLMFLFYQSVTKSQMVQNIIVATLGVLFYSFWVPQITRNVMRGCRRPLSHRYILVMSCARLFLPLYIYAYPDNLVRRETTRWIWALVGYVALQVFILLLQDIFGPRFFVPSKFLPQTYDYHPILSNDDEETTEEQPRLSKDCAICMLPIDTHSSGHAGLLSRANYMVTPCHHLFHTDCLEKWMRIKLECPVCRAYLPAS